MRVRVPPSVRMQLRATEKKKIVVHLMPKRMDQCARCGMRPSPHRVMAFADAVGAYLELPEGYVQCIQPS